MLLFELITGTWSHIQGNLYPWFQAEVGPLTDNHKRLITVLEVVRVEAFVKMHDGVPGRPVEDRQALARALIAKAVHKLPTTRKLMERLHVDTTLRQLCGWECVGELPSESTFSRAYAEFSVSEVPGRVHAALIERTLGDHLVGQISRAIADLLHPAMSSRLKRLSSASGAGSGPPFG